MRSTAFPTGRPAVFRYRLLEKEEGARLSGFDGSGNRSLSADHDHLGSGSNCLSRRNNSMPSMSGRNRSVKTTSGRHCLKTSAPRRPVRARRARRSRSASVTILKPARSCGLCSSIASTRRRRLVRKWVRRNQSKSPRRLTSTGRLQSIHNWARTSQIRQICNNLHAHVDRPANRYL